jgi:hypothetical protein
MRKLKQATQREKARRALKEKATTQAPGTAQPRVPKAGSASRQNGDASATGAPGHDKPHSQAPSSKPTHH